MMASFLKQQAIVRRVGGLFTLADQIETPGLQFRGRTA